ncbi:MAG: hypothetical protein PWP23_2831 [Candidatus Sumerlaeota bacterium]|nr:hypothetical protein [Candidatus Sumerlaeota bacterium]
MPLLHSIALDCVPRRALSDGQLPRLARDRALLAQLEQQLGAPPPGETRLSRVLHRPDGSEEREEFTAAELRASASVLDPLAPSCAGCPAALAGSPFSCVQSLSFPLSASAERWLVGRIGPEDSLSGQFFRASVQAMGYGRDCELLTQWRRSGLLESPEPIRVEGESPVDGDQVLHALLLSGNLEPARCLSALLFTRALGTSTGASTDDLIALISRLQNGQLDGQPPEFVFSLALDPGEDPSTNELRGFLLAAFTAFRLGVGLQLLIVA